jgi:prepilin-type N-terminal cleavage/methylation domain-containing protein
MLKKQSNKAEMPMGMQGFTLIEILIAIAIFSIGILAVSAMQMTSVKGNASARRITEATALAENRIERLLELSYDHNDLNPALNPHQATSGPYEINWTVTESDLDADGINDSKTVSVTVNWTYKGDRKVSIQHIILDR